MGRLWSALCLSVSLVALAFASLALFQDRPIGGDQIDVSESRSPRDVQRLVTSLAERVEALESRQVGPETGVRAPEVSRPGVPTSVPGEPTEPTELQEEVAELTQRLARLEHGTTIAELAQSGRLQLAERTLRTALECIESHEASPETRLEAFQSFRELVKSHGPLVKSSMDESGLEERDLVLPMIDLAGDTGLEPDFRAEVLRSLHGSRIEELRQPMLDLLGRDPAPDVRAEALTTLYWHLDDATVRQAITQAGQLDLHEAVQAAARKVLPKIEYIESQIVESGDSDGSRQK